MSWRKVPSVPAVFVLLLAGLSLMAVGTYGTAPPTPVARRLDEVPEAFLSEGGPDPFGYTYTDSKEPDGATFDWLDITAGTVLNLSDNETAGVSLPFTFTFYGVPFLDVAIFSEGALFLDTLPLDLPGDNESLGTTQLANLIAPFWDNLVAGPGLVYYETLGTSPNRRFVVEWHDRLHYGFEDSPDTVTFELILYEGTNNIKFQYSDTGFGVESLDAGASATAGIRQSDSSYLQYNYNEGLLDSGMAICFRYPGSPPCDLPPRIEVSPTHISATQLAGEVTTHTLSISNSGDLDLTFSLAESPPPGLVPTSQTRRPANFGTASTLDTDLVWVKATPASGTVPGGGGLQVSVTLTAPVQVYGTYTATLRLSSNDPLTPQVDLPLTMTVVLPPRLSIAKRSSSERVDAGSLLTYTLSISNSGGPVSNVAISDTLPSKTALAWASDGGMHIGSEVLWSDLYLLADARLVLSYAVSVTCVPSGTQIVNQDYQVEAVDWPPPVAGQAVTVTAIADAVVAAFDTPPLILCREPVPFTNLSQNATSYLWRFGDGSSSGLDSPVHTYMERGTYSAVLTASNRCSTDEHSRELSVEDLSLVMTPVWATAQAAPGATATYSLSLTNTGTLSDSFTLNLSGQLWSTALSTESIGPLPPGSSGPFQVVVDVPAAAVPGEFDQVLVQAVSGRDPRQPPASASAVLTTTVLTPTALAHWHYLPLVSR